MNPSDREDLTAILSATLELYGRKLSPPAFSIWFEALKHWPLEACKQALGRHVQTGGDHAPVPADIIRLLQADDGWIGAEEAWAIVAKTLSDESVTVFWTRPMQVAFGAAIELQDDKIAARMAFREVYNRELALAREQGERPVWQVSPGTDPQQREPAISEAMRLGRIAPDYAQKLLPGESDTAQHLLEGLQIKQLSSP